jgi:hypothetical protein
MQPEPLPPPSPLERAHSYNWKRVQATYGHAGEDVSFSTIENNGYFTSDMMRCKTTVGVRRTR